MMLIIILSITGHKWRLYSFAKPQNSYSAYFWHNILSCFYTYIYNKCMFFSHLRLCVWLLGFQSRKQKVQHDWRATWLYYYFIRKWPEENMHADWFKNMFLFETEIKNMFPQHFLFFHLCFCSSIEIW